MLTEYMNLIICSIVGLLAFLLLVGERDANLEYIFFPIKYNIPCKCAFEPYVHALEDILTT